MGVWGGVAVVATKIEIGDIIIPVATSEADGERRALAHRRRVRIGRARAHLERRGAGGGRAAWSIGV
jgi:hypothetical protein